MRTLSAVAVAAVALTATPAFAGPKLFSPGNSLMSVSGSVETNVNQNRDPALYQVFSTGNECLRVAVTAQGADLEATLVSPSGRVWQDDDSNGGLRPRVNAVTDTRGWYPLAFSHFNGAVVNADFTFTVQRGPVASCNPVTAPRVQAAPTGQRKAAGAVWGSPPPDGAN